MLHIQLHANMFWFALRMKHHRVMDFPYMIPPNKHIHTLSLSLLLSKDTIISSVTLMVFITINMIPLFVYVINGESLITFKEVKINILL